MADVNAKYFEVNLHHDNMSVTPHFYIVKLGFTGVYILSSPEPLGSQGELIVYPSSRRPSVHRPSVVRRQPFSKIFFSETAWPIKAKFYVEPPWEGGTKVYINGPGHMTKMAAMPIYGKKPFKNLLLQNRWADFHETWYVASGTPAHHS